MSKNVLNWKKSKLVINLVTVFVFTVSCRGGTTPETSVSSPQNNLTESNAGNSPRAITGDWALVSLCGYASIKDAVGSSNYSTKGINLRLDEPVVLSTVNIDAKGNGVMKGLKSSCVLPESSIGTLAGAEATAPAHILDWVHLIRRGYQVYKSFETLVKCNQKGNALEPGSVSVVENIPPLRIFGQKPSIGIKNLGVYGDVENSSAIESECKALRGNRYVKFSGGQFACIGFNNGAGTQLKIIYVNPGEIYGNRMILSRVDIFSSAKPAKCNVVAKCNPAAIKPCRKSLDSKSCIALSYCKEKDVCEIPSLNSCLENKGGEACYSKNCDL